MECKYTDQKFTFYDNNKFSVGKETGTNVMLQEKGKDKETAASQDQMKGKKDFPKNTDSPREEALYASSFSGCGFKVDQRVVTFAVN